MVITKKSGDAPLAELQLIRLVQAIGIGGETVAVPEKRHIECPSEHTFIGAKPLEAFLGSDGQRLIGDGALRGPQPRRLSTEGAFVIVARAPKLVARILGMTISAAGQRSAGTSHPRDIGIADQRKNRMVKRRGTQLDLLALRRFAIGGENHAQQFQLLYLEVSLIQLAVVLPF